MKRLILMRHAKSDWSGGGQDHNRPLNPRGRRAAAAMGDWLRDMDLRPDQVLCSSATRTRETLAGLDLPEGLDTTFARMFYLATHEDILKALHSATGECILYIGHNPGCGVAANMFVENPPDHPQFTRYPTCATLVADFEIETWSEASWQNAIARHFVVPRDL